MKTKLLIPFIMLMLWFNVSYEEFPQYLIQLNTVLKYEWITHPEVRVNPFWGNRDYKIRRLISNIKKRKPTLQEKSLSPNYEDLRNSILGKVI